MKDQKQYKTFAFNVKSFSENVVNGVPIGVIRGYAATFSKDRGGDIILKGAFTKTIEDHKARQDRPIRVYWQHDYKIMLGLAPIHLAFEDEKGLFIEAHINLSTQIGAETYSHAKMGGVTDFSIGYATNDFDFIEDPESKGKLRRIKSLQLYEVSLVTEPMNIDAVVTEVKKSGLVEISNELPFGKAKTWADLSDGDEKEQKFAEPEKHTSTDEVEEVPLQGDQQELNEIEENRKSFIDYHKLMDRNFSKRDLEKVLKGTKCFSTKACATLASLLDKIRVDSDGDKEQKNNGDVLEIYKDIESITLLVKKW